MKRCYCHACRARDDRRFWRIIEPLRERRGLNLPPVPTWEGEPTELDLYRITRKGDRT
jgi:hypothetical protein